MHLCWLGVLAILITCRPNHLLENSGLFDLSYKFFRIVNWRLQHPGLNKPRVSFGDFQNIFQQILDSGIKNYENFVVFVIITSHRLTQLYLCFKTMDHKNFS